MAFYHVRKVFRAQKLDFFTANSSEIFLVSSRFVSLARLSSWRIKVGQKLRINRSNRASTCANRNRRISKERSWKRFIDSSVHRCRIIGVTCRTSSLPILAIKNHRSGKRTNDRPLFFPSLRRNGIQK